MVVLMGVDPVAGTLEFSDPLTGWYNSTTMAQFANTFGIYGDMAIVIDASPMRPRLPPSEAASGRLSFTRRPRMARWPHATPWVSIHHTRATSIFSDETPAGNAAASLGLLTSVSAVAVGKGGGAAPLVATVGAAAIVATALVGIFYAEATAGHAMGDVPSS